MAKVDPELRSKAEIYLRPPEVGFWKWSAEGDAIVWTKGSTIVFRQELAEVMAPLADRGLPSLGAILLLIAATRDNWWPKDGSVRFPIEVLSVVAGPRLAKKELYGETIEALNRVSKLENDLKSSIRSKQTLADYVFEDCEMEHGPEVAREVIDLLANGYQENYVDPEVKAHTTSLIVYRHGADTLHSDLRILRKGLKGLSSEGLRLRRDTGFDAPLTATEEVLVKPEHTSTLVKRLLNDLDTDQELCGIARAARQLMSVLTLPRPIEEREDLSLGGVSDITNRGPLDRLLLSELANDDLTLAVRVAVGEAMYLRRESPPKIAMRQRVMVLDSGIRMWGIPRAIATALGMAVVAGSDPHTDVAAFIAKDSGLEEIDFTTHGGVLQQMETLQPEMHLGRALPELKKKCDEYEQDESWNQSSTMDRILITSPEAFEDFEFKAQLVQSDVFPVFIATVNREGQVRLFEVSGKGKKEVRSAKIDVYEIANSQPLIDKNVARDLPAIFSAKPFPLMLGNSGDLKRAWPIGDEGVIVLTSDWQLSLWGHEGRKGGLQLSQTIEPAPVWWFAKEPIGGYWYAVVGYLRELGLRLIRVDVAQQTADEKVLKIPEGAISFVCHRGSLFAIYPKKFAKIDLETGAITQEVPVQSDSFWNRDRFFKMSDDSWFVLATDEFTAKFEKIPNPRKLNFVSFFEAEHVEGPIGITIDGELYFTGTDRLEKMVGFLEDIKGKKIEVDEISHDGKFVVLKIRFRHAEVSRGKIDVEKLKIKSVPTLRSSLIKSFCRKNVTEVVLRKKFVSVTILKEDDAHRQMRERMGGKARVEPNESGLVISLLSGKKSRVDLFFDSKFGFRLGTVYKQVEVVARKTFSPINGPKGVGYKLSQARWDDGTAIVLDSRGFLHLKSSNLDVPELSITLSEAHAAAIWCSDGLQWGSEFFHLPPKQNPKYMTPARLYSISQEFLLCLKASL